MSSMLVSPPPALAASRGRRQRSNAVSRAHSSESATATAADTSSYSPTSAPSPWRDDELICPLALDAPAPLWGPVHVWPANEGELQAVLAQFAFPSGRKRRRSGEIAAIDHSPSCSAAPAEKRRGAPGPLQRAWCAHCERGRSSA